MVLITLAIVFCVCIFAFVLYLIGNRESGKIPLPVVCERADVDILSKVGVCAPESNPCPTNYKCTNGVCSFHETNIIRSTDRLDRRVNLKCGDLPYDDFKPVVFYDKATGNLKCTTEDKFGTNSCVNFECMTSNQSLPECGDKVYNQFNYKNIYTDGTPVCTGTDSKDWIPYGKCYTPADKDISADEKCNSYILTNDVKSKCNN
jgi:hypothetical protein